MVRTWTASASDSRRRLRSSSLVSSPAAAICWRSHDGQRGGAHLLGRRRGVQELADVAQVGQLALAVDGLQHALREALDQGHGLGQRGDALHAQHARPLVQAAVELLAVLLGGRRDALRRPARGTA